MLGDIQFKPVDVIYACGRAIKYHHGRCTETEFFVSAGVFFLFARLLELLGVLRNFDLLDGLLKLV